jgi:hypothetical protein
MTARERTLAAGFAIILLAGGALIGIIKLKEWKQDIDDTEYEVELRSVEAETLLEQEDLWLQRASWISKQQPIFTNQRNADEEILKLIQDTASARGIDIIQNQVQTNPAAMGNQRASTITVQGRAPFADSMGWLYDLQQPGSFVNIPSISIVPNEEETGNVNISFVLQKWYRQAEEEESNVR